MNFDGPPLDVKTVALDPSLRPDIARADHRRGEAVPASAPFHFHKDNPTALVIPLAHPVGPGESWTAALGLEIERHLGLAAVNMYGLSEIVGPGVAVECIEERSNARTEQIVCTQRRVVVQHECS